MTEGIKTLSRTIDLVYSPDQNGYYLQEYKLDGHGTTRTSQLFLLESDAIKAISKELIQWSKWD